ncbi:VIT1/CCC1 transporter family protein [Nocardioides sp. LMS-CY]|uniref:VIT1/CCC1 family predicted Fe2+/Mn2+ transporter n=1 Tax=Nocardioides soli TaxID=1036020 RepID=A0A7W4VTJ1_9ACTN|nr:MULTISPECIES: VIT1/CCC1 transporter family protein [Nocardioides]MBB3041528.1 VIT1/CCC1 family predicted Fe2+/Mn2+ transporter [Nocardioides soli]QWF23300.1 VIT1/CCC1 transporter family protein [Nocardioides sp. LMS-CY]
MSTTHPTARSEHPLDRYRRHITTEREASALYRGLAQLSRGTRRDAFLELATIEDRHADFWANEIRRLGGEPPEPGEFVPGARTQSLLELARQYTPDLVLPVIEQDERNGFDTYADDPDAPESMLLEESQHADVLGEMIGESGVGERWHRSNKSGTLRAGIFGVNDGLVSNTALVMGFAGASADRGTVLLAGLAGLLAGAFSMGAGEYISMANQREAFEREIALEAEEIRLMPEEEQRELELIYQAKGLTPEDASHIAAQVMSDHEIALDTLAREELGLDPDDLGSPWGAAASSFVAFSLGAVLVVLPYLITGGTAALLGAIGIALLALVAVGAVMARLNGRPMGVAILRQVAVGSLAAAATYGLGSLLGLNLG